MDLTMLLLTIATVILAGGSLGAAVHYGRKAVTEAKSANALASERSVVEWQVGRWDNDNPGHFYAYNSGQDAAHEVTLGAWDGQDRTEVTAEVLEPASGDQHPTLGPSEGYIEFRLPERERHGARPVAGPPPRIPTPEPPPGSFRDWLAESRRQQDEMIAEEIDQREREQVWVRVTWRSKLGRWSTEELQTG
jgi:hypothetical protein